MRLHNFLISVKGAIVTSSLMLGFPSLSAAAYPDAAVRLVVPFGAGGITDIIARHLGKGLSDVLKQSVVVENRGGAGGTIGATAASRAPADGYTVFMGTVGTQIVNPLIMKSIKYSPDDFEPIGMISGSPYVLAVRSALNINNYDELIDYAKANPGKLNFGSAGVGSSPHLGLELLKYTGKVDILHVPFKSGGEAVNAAVGGQVDLVMDAIPVIVPQTQGDRLKALLLASDKPSEAAHGIPTSAEAGNPDLTISSWNALYVPKGTPQEVVNTLRSSLQKALADPTLRKTLEAQGSQVYTGTMTEYDSFMQAESSKWNKIVKEANISLP